MSSARNAFFGGAFRLYGPHAAFHALTRALADQTVVDVNPPLPRRISHALDWRLNWRCYYHTKYRLLPFYRPRERRAIHHYSSETTMYRQHRWKRKPLHVAPYHLPLERTLAIEGAPRRATVGNLPREYAVWAITGRRKHDASVGAEFVVGRQRPLTREGAASVRRLPLGGPFSSGIFDEALLDLYRRSAIFSLPLHDEMGTDALLESLAKGRAIIHTDCSPPCITRARPPCIFLLSIRKQRNL